MTRCFRDELAGRALGAPARHDLAALGAALEALAKQPTAAAQQRLREVLAGIERRWSCITVIDVNAADVEARRERARRRADPVVLVDRWE